ncbi:MAG: LLM class flavin-dependent oxidoreductase [Acidimicrobiia bacterium]
MTERIGLHWFLPMQPDGEFIGTLEPMEREPTLAYLEQVTLAAERAGFDGMLVATGLYNWHENWVAATAALARSSRINMMIAVRPSQLHPVQFAHMAATVQNLFPGRLEINLVTGAARDDGWYGNFDDRDARFVRAREFLEVVRGLWFEDAPWSYDGSFYHVEDCILLKEPQIEVPLYLSGAAPPARELAAEFADWFLMWGTQVERIQEDVEGMRERAREQGRELRFGMRVHVIVRETEDEAWEAADRLISRIHPSVRERQLKELHAFANVGGRAAQQELVQGDLRIAPNLWAGVGLGRWGVATALVGDPSTVAERLREYHEAGIDMFILSGYPKLEEAERFGSLVMPLLRPTGPDSAVDCGGTR